MPTETLEAKLQYVIFENPTNHYVVAQFSEIKTYHVFTATGMINEPLEDQIYELNGQYVTHPRYGKQFQILSAQKKLPNTSDAIVRFLSSDVFPTIGKKTAEDIVNHLGEDCLNQIKEDPSCLDSITKLNHKRKQIIIQGIQDFDGFSQTYAQLMQWGLDQTRITLLQEHYEDVMDVIQEDCFRPYYEINGFGYKSACKLANGMELPAKDLRRQDAYIHETICQAVLKTGNTYITLPWLMAYLAQVDQQLIIDSVHRLAKQEIIRLVEDRIYPFHLYEEEQWISSILLAHSQPIDEIEVDTINNKIKAIEFENAITYENKQKQAIFTFFQNSVMLINGGPGTGKTTIVKGILELCQDFYPDATIQLCAPTGRAAKRLARLSCYSAKTIHSLLKWNMEDNSFGMNEDDPIEADFLIVDEFSMVDTHIFAALLKALEPHCHILLIGDENQLESVGPGKVFKDIIDSHLFPIIHLEKIFRQANGSGIVTLANQIRTEQTCTYEDGVTFIEQPTENILPTILSITQNYDINSFEILAPMYHGGAGIDQINMAMQKLKNPPSANKAELHVGATIFREDDKVMLLKNLPDDNVFNGDIGTIIAIETKKKEYCVSVDFGENVVDFDSDILYYLKHAYCISIHKSQGSEYPMVICVVDKINTRMLNQRLLYTAISRAKKELFIIGQLRLFESSVKTKQRHIRQTTLKQALQHHKTESE